MPEPGKVCKEKIRAKKIK